MTTSILKSRFWLPLLIAAGTFGLAPLFRPGQPALQSHGLAFLLSVTVALSGYLFVVIAQPEKF